MIYLDNAATTRPAAGAVAYAETFLREEYFNPSALYGGGFAVRGELEKARAGLLSRLADGETYELVFTSCGTEADGQAIFSCARRGNAVTTAGEHAAVYESFRELKNRGVEPRFAPLNRDGSVNIEALLELVDERTSFVSVMHVNNETGAVNDIEKIAKEVKKRTPSAIFHSDGVQAFGKIPYRLSGAVDLYSVSAHKIGGLKGTGALVKKKQLALRPLVFGGGQERGLRSGTENVFGIVAFARAAAEWGNAEEHLPHVRRLNEMVRGALENVLILSPEEGSPYILTLAAEGLRGEVLQRMLWERGVVVGTGSACSSKSRFSRVLSACGYPERVLDGVLRLSFSPQNTEEEALAASRAVNEVISEFRRKI